MEHKRLPHSVPGLSNEINVHIHIDIDKCWGFGQHILLI